MEFVSPDAVVSGRRVGCFLGPGACFVGFIVGLGCSFAGFIVGLGHGFVGFIVGLGGGNVGFIGKPGCNSGWGIQAE